MLELTQSISWSVVIKAQLVLFLRFCCLTHMNFLTDTAYLLNSGEMAELIHYYSTVMNYVSFLDMQRGFDGVLYNL